MDAWLLIEEMLIEIRELWDWIAGEVNFFQFGQLKDRFECIHTFYLILDDEQLH